MSEKTYTRAGISTSAAGKRRFRVTNDPKRERVCEKAGDTDIQFWDFDEPKTKEEAFAFLTAKGLTENKSTGTKTARKPRVAAAPAAPADNAPTRKDDEKVLKQLVSGQLAYFPEDDDFKEPKEEAIQVEMARLARANPTMPAKQLHERALMRADAERGQ